MSKKEQRTKRIEARVTPSFYKKVEKVAKVYKWPISAVIQEALSDFMTKR